jgi:uncharacterized protein (TIGR02231 family)
MRFALPVLALGVLSTHASAADVSASSKVDAVTVYAQGAEVTRISKVKFEPGAHTVILTDLPASALPSSIRVEGKSTGRLEIGSVDSRVTPISLGDQAQQQSERKALESDVEKLQDEKAQIAGQIQAAETQKALINNLVQLPNRPPPPQGSTAPIDWTQLLTLVGERTAAVQREIVGLQSKTRDLDRRIEELKRRMALLVPKQEARTEIKINVNAGAPLEADLAIKYQVANANWTPLYDARLTIGNRSTAPKLDLVRRATIQQRTGEAWENVTLALSTARPTAGTAAPELRPWTIDFEGERPPPPPAAAPAPVGAARSFSKAADEMAATAEFASRAGERMRQHDATPVAATIDAQAFQAIYGIPGRTSVASTGEQKRVHIDDAMLEPALYVRTVPKREAKAYLYAKLKMPAGSAVLPGQVAIFRDGTFVGNGRLPQLAPGEEHELGFGADDNIKVMHTLIEEKRAEGGIISSTKTELRAYKITLKNLHPRAMPVTLVDQVPAANNQDIRIDVTARPAATKIGADDKRGVYTWEMELKPEEERIVELGWKISWPGAKRLQYGN